jgi:hypothetical protein
MRMLFRIEDAGAFADRLHEPVFPQLFGSGLRDEAAAAASADKRVDPFDYVVW